MTAAIPTSDAAYGESAAREQLVRSFGPVECYARKPKPEMNQEERQ